MASRHRARIVEQWRKRRGWRGHYVFPGMVSPARLALSERVFADSGSSHASADYSETLDGPHSTNTRDPAGGTPVGSVALWTGAPELELGRTLRSPRRPNLSRADCVGRRQARLPLGVLESDPFFAALSD